MSHVLVSTSDVELALDATWALEDAGYEVEFARLIRETTATDLPAPPRAMVLDCGTPRDDLDLARSWADRARIALVVVSSRHDGPELARWLGAVHVPGPRRADPDLRRSVVSTLAKRAGLSWGAALTQAVSRSMHGSVPPARPERLASAEVPVMAPVLVVARRELARAVGAAVLAETGFASVLATDAAAAVGYLGEAGPARRASVALVDEAMLRCLGGSALAHALRVLEVPTIALREGSGSLTSQAAEAVKDILPILYALLEDLPVAASSRTGR